MAVTTKKLTPLSHEEIDMIVTDQANEDSAWEEAIYVRRAPSAMEQGKRLAKKYER